MNILTKIEEISLFVEGMKEDAASAQYSRNKSARVRLKRDLRELLSRCKNIRDTLREEDKNDRKRKISEVPLL